MERLWSQAPRGQRGARSHGCAAALSARSRPSRVLPPLSASPRPSARHIPGRESIAWAERSDSVRNHGDAFSVLAEVLEAAGRRDGATAAWREALDRYERKQVIPFARRVRERLSELQPS